MSWFDYLTWRDHTLELKSENHEYLTAGKYCLVVKVIDIFANDTSQAFDVEIK